MQENNLLQRTVNELLHFSVIRGMQKWKAGKADAGTGKEMS